LLAVLRKLLVRPLREREQAQREAEQPPQQPASAEA